MAEEYVIVNKEDLEVIADAARNQTGTDDKYSISELAQAMANVFVPTVTEKWQMLYTDNNSELNWSQVPFVTPQMFGAVGDGVTDDTAAFQATIDFISIYNSHGVKGGTIFIPRGRYVVSDLFFYKTGSISMIGESRGNSTTLKYIGTNFCINIHGCTHLKLENFTITKASDITAADYSGGIRLLDRDESVSDEEYYAGLDNGTYADSRNGDVILKYLKIVGFNRGVAIDSPAGYITIDETYIEQIQPNGYAISLGEHFNVQHLTSGRYTVPPAYIYINKVFCGGDEWVGKEKGNPIAGLIGMFYCHDIFISNCDFCNMKSGHAIFGTDAYGEILDIYMYENYFFNIKNPIYFEKVTEDATRVFANIHSKANRYFIGNWEESVPFTLKANSSRTIYGFSSVGDVFESNDPSFYKYLYDLAYVRNVNIGDCTVTPNSDFVDLWSSNLYNFDNVTNIQGTKTLTMRVDATTSANGTVEIPINGRIWTYTPAVLTNIADALGTQYNVTVSALSNTSVTLRFRKISDGSAVANTAIATRIILTGI